MSFEMRGRYESIETVRDHKGSRDLLAGLRFILTRPGQIVLSRSP